MLLKVTLLNQFPFRFISKNSQVSVSISIMDKGIKWVDFLEPQYTTVVVVGNSFAKFNPVLISTRAMKILIMIKP